MNPIYKAAVQTAENNGSISSIVVLIEALDDECQEQAIKYLLGLLDPNEVLPSTSAIKKDATLLSYNWLKNEVRYKCTSTTTKYFKSEEAAQRFTETGEYNYQEASWSQSNDYPYTGIYTFLDCVEYTTRERWVEEKV